MMQTVAIVGVGLIGGSFALALRAAGFQGRILGVSSRATAEKAIAGGVIDEALPLDEACRQADLVYLAHAISRILDLIPEVAKHVSREALVTDAGSTKRLICEAAARSFAPAQFVGGHPMAGKESRGVEFAEGSLFRDRTYILTPLEQTKFGTPRHNEFVGWLKKIGARTLVLSPEAHDNTVALTSHLPQLASTAIAVTVGNHLPDPSLLEAGGPGLADMTRLALSSHEIWADILCTNRESVAKSLEQYIETLKRLQSKLVSGSTQEMFAEGAGTASQIRRK